MTAVPAVGADALHQALKTYFGFSEFRPGQIDIIRDAMAGRDVLAVMPTGGGKSLCFQLPALLLPGLTLVVSPLIALMQDQVRLLRANGIEAGLLNSAQTATEAAACFRAIEEGRLKLLYVAPERLLMTGFLERLRQMAAISQVVIDEAHCVSDWGHDFRPEYRRLASVRERLPEVPILGFTATATPAVRDDIVNQLQLREPARHVASFDRPNLYWSVETKDRGSYDRLLARARKGGSGIVYCLSRKRVDDIAARLLADGIEALPYHAGLNAAQRNHNQSEFIRDAAQVMVATVAFGMGINKPDVRWVVHFDLPRSLEAYYQEGGRAGRDGEPGECVLYFSAGDLRTADQLIRSRVDAETGEPLQAVQAAARAQLQTVVHYAESPDCRRVLQLAYFGEPFSAPCGGCDNCLNPPAVDDVTLAARQLLSTVARLGQRGQAYGSAHVIDILRGEATDKVIAQGHDQLSVFGIGRGLAPPRWRTLIRRLLADGALMQRDGEYPVLQITADARPLLKGERVVTLPQATRGATKSNSRRAAAGPVDDPLFQALRQLRLRLARENDVPPYVVFTDVTLHALAEQRPLNLQAFADIPGVGQRKLDQWGAIFVEAIRDFHDS
ncbi:MAG: DNA helicase RecQ [Polycyclovorans sp.]|jgi:ATP-dependent DNA helicase RecQ|nr:DNA helicase RecQ [Polycyclovorans sp.]MDP1541960.1 DNA helicase RecQ [Polycyclovorans sp.]MEC8849450.1 DNA helicase RecQ [Pseudomonadota bacterium]|tara:strand:+ start:3392 stop:5233 length:1842 start_codon:yes stop_codon:yes gene_type:complete